MQEEAILEFSYDAVYYVHSDDPNIPLSPIAIRPYLREGYIGWEDTIRGRLFRVRRREVITHNLYSQ